MSGKIRVREASHFYWCGIFRLRVVRTTLIAAERAMTRRRRFPFTPVRSRSFVPSIREENNPW